MIDLNEVRALAAATRESASSGLRERTLADYVDRLISMLGAPSTEWGARWQTDLGGGVLPRDDEQDARAFIASLPVNVQHMWRVVQRAVYRHEGPWEAGDE